MQLPKKSNQDFLIGPCEKEKPRIKFSKKVASKTCMIYSFRFFVCRKIQNIFQSLNVALFTYERCLLIFCILKLQDFNEKQPIESLKITIKLLIK